jgi:hypothetical protein
MSKNPQLFIALADSQLEKADPPEPKTPTAAGPAPGVPKMSGVSSGTPTPKVPSPTSGGVAKPPKTPKVKTGDSTPGGFTVPKKNKNVEMFSGAPKPKSKAEKVSAPSTGADPRQQSMSFAPPSGGHQQEMFPLHPKPASPKAPATGVSPSPSKDHRQQNLDFSAKKTTPQKGLGKLNATPSYAKYKGSPDTQAALKEIKQLAASKMPSKQMEMFPSSPKPTGEKPAKQLEMFPNSPKPAGTPPSSAAPKSSSNQGSFDFTGKKPQQMEMFGASPKPKSSGSVGGNKPEGAASITANSSGKPGAGGKGKPGAGGKGKPGPGKKETTFKTEGFHGPNPMSAFHYGQSQGAMTTQPGAAPAIVGAHVGRVLGAVHGATSGKQPHKLLTQRANTDAAQQRQLQTNQQIQGGSPTTKSIQIPDDAKEKLEPTKEEQELDLACKSFTFACDLLKAGSLDDRSEKRAVQEDTASRTVRGEGDADTPDTEEQGLDWHGKDKKVEDVDIGKTKEEEEAKKALDDMSRLFKGQVISRSEREYLLDRGYSEEELRSGRYRVTPVMRAEMNSRRQETTAKSLDMLAKSLF